MTTQPKPTLEVVEMGTRRPAEVIETTRTRLVDSLRSAMAKGLLAPGEKLNEREICEEYGVSRTVVRETFRQLEAEGFVTVTPHKGAVVAEMSYSRAMHLFELRGSLESLACQLCAQRATFEQKRALSHAVDAIEQSMRAGELDGLVKAKNDFYEVLLEGAGNAELAAMLQLLHARIELLRRYSLSSPGRHAKSILEIREIFNAILAGDGEAARVAGVHHVAQAKAAALPRVFMTELSSAAQDEPSKE